MAQRMDDQIEGAQVTYAQMSDEIESLRQQLAAALAACESKDVEIRYVSAHYSFSSTLANHLQAALAIKPDASALKAHDEEKDKIIELLRVDLAANRERADSLQDKLNEIYWRQSQ